jgi:hypothetical protein
MRDEAARFHLFESFLNGLPVDNVHDFAKYVGCRIDSVSQMTKYSLKFFAVTLARKRCRKQRH